VGVSMRYSRANALSNGRSAGDPSIDTVSMTTGTAAALADAREQPAANTAPATPIRIFIMHCG
jgi:hypothetical protein